MTREEYSLFTDPLDEEEEFEAIFQDTRWDPHWTPSDDEFDALFQKNESHDPWSDAPEVLSEYLEIRLANTLIAHWLDDLKVAPCGFHLRPAGDSLVSLGDDGRHPCPELPLRYLAPLRHRFALMANCDVHDGTSCQGVIRIVLNDRLLDIAVVFDPLTTGGAVHFEVVSNEPKPEQM